MAIANLMAILNVDDIDKIISLLEQNNWDESVCISVSYLWQQMYRVLRQLFMLIRFKMKIEIREIVLHSKNSMKKANL
jgi:hypothetical protein